MLGSRNKRLVGEGINELVAAHGLPRVEGFAERVVFREFFPRGLTALDDLDEETLGTRPNMSHVTAREEVDDAAQFAAAAAVARTASGAPRPARNGTRSWTSRCRCTISSHRAR